MNNKQEKAALLVMDVQSGIIGRMMNKDEYVANVAKAVNAAHEKGILVIYVVVGFRAGLPEFSSHNKFFEPFKESASAGLVNPHPAIEPMGNDVVVIKRRVSAFSGSDLEVILRANEIRHLVLLGVATSGVVLSTVREASDKDYKLTVLADLCSDSDEEVHKVLLEKILPKQADVTTCGAWISSQGQSS